MRQMVWRARAGEAYHSTGSVPAGRRSAVVSSLARAAPCLAAAALAARLHARARRLHGAPGRLHDAPGRLPQPRRVSPSAGDGEVDVNGFYPVGYPFIAQRPSSGWQATSSWPASSSPARPPCWRSLAVYWGVDRRILGRGRLAAGRSHHRRPASVPSSCSTPPRRAPTCRTWRSCSLSVGRVIRLSPRRHPSGGWCWRAWPAALLSGALHIDRCLIATAGALWFLIYRPFPGRNRRDVRQLPARLQHRQPRRNSCSASCSTARPSTRPHWPRTSGSASTVAPSRSRSGAGWPTPISLESVISFDIWRFLASWAVNATQPVIVNDVADVVALGAGSPPAGAGR